MTYYQVTPEHFLIQIIHKGIKPKEKMMDLVTQPTYFKYKECKKGQTLIENGKFLETKEGKYGAQHYFEESNGERKVLNSAGQLNYLVESYLEKGKRCKIVFGGKEVLEKGDMAGKEANQFELYVDNQSPAPTQQDLPLEGMTSENKNLDNLE